MNGSVQTGPTVFQVIYVYQETSGMRLFDSVVDTLHFDANFLYSFEKQNITHNFINTPVLLS